ncbi:MAG TPA: hypothetical protein DEB06_09470 [Phycisphaerales bacterium]|nr:hypothetical protein [Phycisphaerales bacterium]
MIESEVRVRNHRSSWRVQAAAGLASIGAAGAAFGQADVQRRLERAVRTADPSERLRIDTSLTLGERSYVDAGGVASLAFVNLNDENNNARRLWQPEVTLYARAVVDGAHTFFGRTRFQYRAFSEGDSFDERGDRWVDPFIDRYWYEFDSRRYAAAYEGRTTETNFNIRLGRQFVDWGAGLALSENVYAARPTFEWGSWSVDGIAGVTPGDKSVVDFDASRKDFDSATYRAYFGGRLAYRTPGSKEFYAYVLHQEDQNGNNGPRVNLGVPVAFEYDSTYVGVGSTGSFSKQWLYLGEFVYEFGNSQSDPLRGAQTEEDIRAWAARGQVTYLFGDPGRTRFEFEVLLASGDDDRLIASDTVGGNLTGTDDEGFNSLGFANTGLAFAAPLSNLWSMRAGISSFPFNTIRELGDFQIGLDLFLFNKLDEDAPIDEFTTTDRFLGFESDVYLNWRLTSDLAFAARYGAFFPGEAIGGSSHTRMFVFLGFTLSF